MAYLFGDKGYYVHTDNLDTPQVLTDSQQKVVWTTQTYPFGKQQYSGSVAFNLRYPGQYFDEETGFHYNGHRYYDPNTGRYITSDPIGLAGGLNTYAYVGNDPIGYSDETGLNREIIIWSPMLYDPGSWFGHVSSVSGDGINNSFGPNGWDTKFPTKDEYVNRQTIHNGRTGWGLEIGLTPDQDKQFDQCMSQERKDNQEYKKLLNNCTTSAQACLWKAGVNFQLSVTPNGVMQSFLDANVVNRIKLYSGKKE